MSLFDRLLLHLCDMLSDPALLVPCSLSAEVKASHPVSHALKIRAAYSAHDYVSFFRLYDSAPNLNKRLLGKCSTLRAFA